MRIDLHIHSTTSDGSLGAHELLCRAAQVGLDVCAITDHDTLKGYQKVLRALLQTSQKLQVVFGIEVSACDPKTQKVVHILGYNFVPILVEGCKQQDNLVELHKNYVIEQVCADTLRQRLDNAHEQIDELAKHGYRISRDDVLMYAQESTTIYKQHIMRALTSRDAQDRAYKQLYRELFGRDGLVRREVVYPDFREVLDALHQDGAWSVLAHPGQSKVYDFVPEMVKCGLGGIERNHPDHGRIDHEICDELCGRYGLIATGGSDYHGSYGKHDMFGDCVVSCQHVPEVCSILGLNERS